MNFKQSPPALLTTAEYAEHERTKPQTIRKNYCLHGHHHGIRPIKLPGGRLRWPLADIAAMLSGGASNG